MNSSAIRRNWKSSSPKPPAARSGSAVTRWAIPAIFLPFAVSRPESALTSPHTRCRRLSSLTTETIPLAAIFLFVFGSDPFDEFQERDNNEDPYFYLITAAALFAAETPATFNGRITDTMCGSKPHSAMMKDKTDAECVRICARGPHEYALFDGAAVLRLSDQKKAAKFAGQPVRITGNYDDKNKTIRVIAIEPVTGR